MNLNIDNNSNKINFQAHYKSLKAVKKINCGCCDCKLIDSYDLKKAYIATSKPLLKMIEKGYMSKWANEIPIWNTLLKYAQIYPKDCLDKILANNKAYNEIKNAILKVINPNNDLPENKVQEKLLTVQTDLTNSSRAEMKSAKAVLKRFSTFKDCLKADEKESFEFLEYYADLYPRENLKEIINHKEIINFHKDLHIKQKIKNERKRELHFNKIDKIIKKSNPEVIEHFKSVRETATQLLQRNGDINANQYEVKKLYIEELTKTNCEKLINKVLDELSLMPLKNQTSDGFFSYAALKNLDDGEILYYLMSPSLKTFEHIKARSEGGENKIENGILLCSQCNRARSSIPYETFLEYHPMMPYNTQKQILQIGDYILNGKFNSDFKYWPIEVAATLNENTNGKINPDISTYCKKSAKKLQRQQNERKEQISSLNQSIKDSKQEKNNLWKQIQKIERDINSTKNKVKNLNKENDEDEKLQKRMKEWSKNS